MVLYHFFGTQMTEEVVGVEFRQKWVELQRVLERQRQKGGIIDPEEESNRFLIHINEVRLAVFVLFLGTPVTVAQ